MLKLRRSLVALSISNEVKTTKIEKNKDPGTIDHSLRKVKLQNWRDIGNEAIRKDILKGPYEMYNYLVKKLSFH